MWVSVDPTAPTTAATTTMASSTGRFLGSGLVVPAPVILTPVILVPFGPGPCGSGLSDSSAGSVSGRFRYTFDLYLCSEKLHHFGVETADALHSWTRSIGKVWPSSSVIPSPAPDPLTSDL